MCVHCVFTVCSLCIHCVFTVRSLCVHCVFTVCSMFDMIVRLLGRHYFSWKWDELPRSLPIARKHLISRQNYLLCKNLFLSFLQSSVFLFENNMVHISPPRNQSHCSGFHSVWVFQNALDRPPFTMNAQSGVVGWTHIKQNSVPEMIICLYIICGKELCHHNIVNQLTTAPTDNYYYTDDNIILLLVVFLK